MTDVLNAHTPEGACFRLNGLLNLERELQKKTDWTRREQLEALTKYYVLASGLMNLDMALYPPSVRPVVEQLQNRSDAWRDAA